MSKLTHFGKADRHRVKLVDNLVHRQAHGDGGVEDSRTIQMQAQIVTAGNSAHLQTQVFQDYHSLESDATHVINEAQR